jgi:hypothetical protein
MKAPEQPFVRVRHTRIVVGENELSFPSQGGTKILTVRVESVVLGNGT